MILPSTVAGTALSSAAAGSFHCIYKSLPFQMVLTPTPHSGGAVIWSLSLKHLDVSYEILSSWSTSFPSARRTARHYDFGMNPHIYEDYNTVLHTHCLYSPVWSAEDSARLETARFVQCPASPAGPISGNDIPHVTQAPPPHYFAGWSSRIQIVRNVYFRTWKVLGLPQVYECHYHYAVDPAHDYSDADPVF